MKVGLHEGHNLVYQNNKNTHHCVHNIQILVVKATKYQAEILNKNPAVLNIIESYFLHQTEVDIKAMDNACKTVIKTNIYFPPITTLDCKNLLKNN